MSRNFRSPIVFALRGNPPSRQQSTAHCAYSRQLHCPAFAKCKIPPSTFASKNWGSIAAISSVYEGVEKKGTVRLRFAKVDFCETRCVDQNIKSGIPQFLAHGT